MFQHMYVWPMICMLHAMVRAASSVAVCGLHVLVSERQRHLPFLFVSAPLRSGELVNSPRVIRVVWIIINHLSRSLCTGEVTNSIADF